MKKRSHIFMYVVAACCTAMLSSCSSRNMEEEKSVAMNDSVAEQVVVPEDALENAFEVDTLSDRQLRLFEERAVQKVQDLAGYVEIIGNKNYNTELRKAALDQAYGLFSDTTAQVDIPLAQAHKKLPLPQFLQSVYSSDYDSIHIATDSVVVNPLREGTTDISEALESNMDRHYFGFIRGTLHLEAYKNGRVAFNSVTHQSVTVTVFKTSKLFGTERKRVWTTALHEIKAE